MPPSGREGDRVAVEGARGRKSKEYHIAAGLSHEDSPVPIIPIEKADIDQFFERHTVLLSKSQCPSWPASEILTVGGDVPRRPVSQQKQHHMNVI